MSAWSRFYEYKLNQLYLKNLERKYRPFLDLIIAQNPSSLIETGCGTGNITRLLTNDLPNADFTCLDRDRKMLTLCENNLRESPHRSRIRIKRQDITARGYGTSGSKDNRVPVLLHSHGVLEHFNDRDIETIIDNQLRVTSRLIHYVPSSKYGSKAFGDERLLSSNDWQRICNPSRIVEFNQGFDLALIWE